MKGLSEEGQAAARELWKVRHRLWGRERRALEILGRIAGRQEPMAIPDVVAFLPGAGVRVAAECARIVGALLGAVPNAGLVELDGCLRGHRGWFHDPWRELTPADMDRVGRLGDGAAAVLAACCSHPNGYVRERALRLLAREGSGLELRFLLLRANDWVEPVREVARQAIRERLVPGYAGRFVACLDLLPRLERATRGGPGPLVRQVAGLVTAPEAAQALLDGLGAGDPRLRRLAYRMALESPLAGRAIASGLDTEDPLIRLWCARKAQGVLEGDDLEEVAARLGRDPFPPVRREGLRAIVARFPERADGALRAALLDRSRALREEARHHLGSRSAFDAASFYRQALREGSDRGAALCGLGETGAEEDVRACEEALADPTPRIRAAALRGVVRLSAELPVERLLAGLADRSPRVSRLAARALQPWAPGLDGRRLWDAWERGEGHVRRHVLWLFEAMRKWRGGVLLLRATGARDDAAGAMARQSLDRWLARYNRSFEAPSKGEWNAFAEAVAAADVDESIREHLRHIARSWASGPRSTA